MWAACSSENASFDHGHAAHGLSKRIFSKDVEKCLKANPNPEGPDPRLRQGGVRLAELSGGCPHNLCVCTCVYEAR